MKPNRKNFMAGRYGMDGLNKFLLGAAAVCLALSIFLRIDFFNLLGLIVLAACYLRMMSRNIGKRYQENQVFEAIKSTVLERWKNVRYPGAGKQGFHIFKCPKCGQKIRIPRGKGKISIHCPKCGNDFIKKS